MAAANGRRSSASSPHMRATEPLDRAALGRLIASQPPLEAFGPDSDHLALLVETAAVSAAAAVWLQRLPCPVIGIGKASAPALKGIDTFVQNHSDAAKFLRNIATWPMTAMLLVQHLRASAGVPIDAALTAESLAYATAQHGAEFRRWQGGAGEMLHHPVATPPLRLDYRYETLVITLADPANRNAIGTVMRDALCEALDLALATGAPVHLAAAGRSFSTGGEVSEFGSVADPATAHWIRSLRLPATRLARLAPRLSAHVQGAAIGAGAEIAAFASRLTAGPSAWFQLPELKYGLIPGAGGTASITTRIGRHRAAFMALSMARVPARIALDWGLVDSIEGG